MGLFRSLFTAVFACVGSFLFGYDSGVITNVIAQEHFVSHFENPSAAAQGGIVSAYTGGAVLGCIVIFYVGDPLGRTRSIFVGSFVLLFGSALQTGCTTVAMLIAGRLIAGIAIGMLSSTNPVYCSEIAPVAWRGIMAGLQQWMLSWGFFAAQWIGYGSSYADSAFQWRFPLAFQCVPALILCLGILFQLESPRWLVQKGRLDKAKETLRKLHYDGHNDDFLELEYNEIQAQINLEKNLSAKSWKSLLGKASSRKRVYLACGIQLAGQLSGINVINYYGPRIYAALDIDTQTSLMIIGISGALSIVWCTIGLWLSESIGRVKPLIIACYGMACCLLINAVLSQTVVAAGTTNHNALRASVSMNFLISFFFTPLGINSWIYPAEIFNTETRARGNALATVTNWIFNLIFAQISPIALEAVGYRYFYAFMAFNIVTGTCFWIFYPETRGKTLEQMGELFGDEVIHVDATSSDEYKASSTGEKDISGGDLEKK
ncbi:general substrate transporter [Zychaea mexicana]|uniref:general substrate transporter n=1 Tax=Zychaea mexicana TaxID=64656 RepID=UPI0022FEE5C6|nr:general substrate transporter [Zychaea mexicana]KAI9488488.1 general substrate transporter [Zychaea mexicana]